MDSRVLKAIRGCQEIKELQVQRIDILGRMKDILGGLK